MTESVISRPSGGYEKRGNDLLAGVGSGDIDAERARGQITAIAELHISIKMMPGSQSPLLRSRRGQDLDAAVVAARPLTHRWHSSHSLSQSRRQLTAGLVGTTKPDVTAPAITCR